MATPDSPVGGPTSNGAAACRAAATLSGPAPGLLSSPDVDRATLDRSRHRRAGRATRRARRRVVDLAVAPLRAKIVALNGATSGHGASSQTLRHVTSLILDIVGSTSHSQHLDPEDVHALMDGALARYTDIVAAHGGKVLQYAGSRTG